MTVDNGPFDPGLQLERTSLAWQRTTLALVVGSLAFGRGLAPVLGSAALVVACAGIILSGAMFVVARRRYRFSHDRLTGSATGSSTTGSSAPGSLPPGSLPTGGALLACAAMLTLVIGVGALLFVAWLAAS